MGEKKTKFELNDARVTELPVKCCGRCIHGREKKDPVNLRTMIECFALPPTPVLIGTQQGVQIQSLHPVMDPASDCDSFSIRGLPLQS